MAIKSALNQPPKEFGAPLFEYRPSRLLGLFGVLLLVFQVGLLIITYEEMLPFTLVLPILLAVVGFPLGFACALQLVKTPYIVCPEGVAFFRRRRWHVCPWDEVQAIWMMATFYFNSCAQDYSCDVLCQDGTRVRLKHFHSDEFFKGIEQEVYRALVPKVRAQWASGQPVWFGSVSLSQVGVHCGKAVLRWGDIQSIQPERDESDIVIRARGRQIPWKGLDGISIPNPALFFQLVQENLSGQGD